MLYFEYQLMLTYNLTKYVKVKYQFIAVNILYIMIRNMINMKKH